MGRHTIGATAGLATLLAACAVQQAPVPLTGTASDIGTLVGQWVGEYSSTETGRSGSISFTLAARGDTARGDVIMIPRGMSQPLRAWRDEPPSAVERTRPEVLSIRFVRVRVRGDEVSGALDPYRDPDCGCALYTRFLGRLKGDTIAGTYFSSHRRSEAESQGQWKVSR